MLAESLMVKGGGYIGVGLGEGERNAVSHREILAVFTSLLELHSEFPARSAILRTADALT
jgi:hypothetical protein